MKRSIFLTLALLGALLTTFSVQKRAEALPFVDLGAKVGVGTGMITGNNATDTEVKLRSFGLAGSLDLVLAQLEVNVLYHTLTMGSESKDTNFLAIPVIGRVDISPIPMFKLAVGGGYERRFYMEDKDGVDPELNYIPLSARADLKVPLIGTFGLETRFNYQLGDKDSKVHEFMIFIHAFL